MTKKKFEWIKGVRVECDICEQGLSIIYVYTYKKPLHAHRDDINISLNWLLR